MHTVIYIRFKKGKDECVPVASKMSSGNLASQKLLSLLLLFHYFFVYLFFCTLNQSSFAYISEPKHTNPGKKETIFFVVLKAADGKIGTPCAGIKKNLKNPLKDM